MSVALAPELWEEVRAAADRAGKSPDDWFADAAEAKLSAEEDAAAIEDAARRKRHQALGAYLDEWEAAGLAGQQGTAGRTGQGPARCNGAACQSR